MANRRNRQDREYSDKLAFAYRIATIIGSVVNNLIRWCGISFLALCIYWSVEAISGKTTLAGITVDFLARVGVSRWLAWLLAFGGVGYGVQQRRLRRRTISRLETHVKQLEKEIDRKRTSSGLTPTGVTHPKDEL